MKQKINWSRYAGYECSSKGDRTYSALYAKLMDGRTIEEAYQLDVKGYRKYGNNASIGKGKAPLFQMTRKESYEKYLNLWKTWANENKINILILREYAKQNNNTLRDSFANTEINQARALCDILNTIEQ